MLPLPRFHAVARRTPRPLEAAHTTPKKAIGSASEYITEEPSKYHELITLPSPAETECYHFRAHHA